MFSPISLISHFTRKLSDLNYKAIVAFAIGHILMSLTKYTFMVVFSVQIWAQLATEASLQLKVKKI